MNNKEILLNDGWKFKLCPPKDLQSLDFDSFLPHTKAGTSCGFVENMVFEILIKEMQIKAQIIPH